MAIRVSFSPVLIRCAVCFLTLCDCPVSRQYLHKRLDLSVFISGLAGRPNSMIARYIPEKARKSSYSESETYKLWNLEIGIDAVHSFYLCVFLFASQLKRPYKANRCASPKVLRVNSSREAVTHQ